VLTQKSAAMYAGPRPGYGTAMTSHPHQPSSDEADPEKETTPAGVARDLEEKAEELGASTAPDMTPHPDQTDSDEADEE
jgi:hypothetical protein